MNRDIKLFAAGKGVRLWQIAQAIGVTEFTLSRWLRNELPQDKRLQVVGAIEKLSTERGA